LVGSDGHRREQLHAIRPAALVLTHHPVIEAHGGFGR